MEHGVGMDLAALAQGHLVVEDDAGMEGAAAGHDAAGADHHMGSHMGLGRHAGAGVDHGAGMDPRRSGCGGMEGGESLGEAEAGVLQGHPGDAPRTGQLLQLVVERQEQGGSRGGGEGGGQGVAGLQEGELADTGAIEGFAAADLRVVREVTGTALLHR